MPLYRTIVRYALLGGGLLGAAFATPAAALTTISSAANGISVSLTFASFATASIGPIASIGSTASPAYDLTGGVASFDQTLSLASSNLLRERVQTGSIVTTAVSANPATPTGSATARVDGLVLNLQLKASVLPAINVLRITADSVSSMSMVEADGAASASGSASLTNLRLSGTLFSTLPAITVGANLAPAADTVLLDALGLKVVLNERITSGDTAASAGITTSALRLRFKDFLVGGGLLNGDIIVAQTRAFAFNEAYNVGEAVPEPAIWAQMIAGFALVGTATRRARRRRLTA